MKRLFALVLVLVIAPGAYYLSHMDYTIPLGSGLQVCSYSVAGEPERVCISVEMGTKGVRRVEVLADRLRYAREAMVTYGEAEGARFLGPEEDLRLHDRKGLFAWFGQGGDMPRQAETAYFILV
jgi:hypothetical protein